MSTDDTSQSSWEFPDTQPVFTIGIASKLTNTSVHALRVYEEKKLILPYITETNRRLYSQFDIERIKCIRRHLDEEGLNIAGIKALLAMLPCWLLRPCSAEDQQACEAFTCTTAPCWEVGKKGPECQDIACRDCQVYRMGYQCGDIKSFCKSAYNGSLNITKP